MIREGRIHKVYWALTEATPDPESGELRHYILRDGRTNRSRACDAPGRATPEARLRYATLGAGTNHTLVEVELLTGASPPDPRPALRRSGVRSAAT